MRYKLAQMAIFILLSLFQALPALSNEQDKIQYAFSLFEIMEKGPEKERQLAWQKFVKNLPPPSSDFIDSRYLVNLENIISKMPEPYKRMAWEETAVRLRIDSTHDSTFLVGLVLTVPEPYKGFAWSMLNSWQFLTQTHIQIFHNYYRIVIDGPEPYKIWAWQQLQAVLQKMADEKRIGLADIGNYWTNIIQQAPEPYKLWAWQKLLSDESSSYFFDHLADVITQNRGQYPELAWTEITKHENEFWTEGNIHYLKRITRVNNLHYQKLAVSKLLTLKSLKPEDRETAIEMYRVFYSVEEENNYSINWRGFISYNEKSENKSKEH